MTATITVSYDRIVVTQDSVPGFVFTARITTTTKTVQMPAVTVEGGE